MLHLLFGLFCGLDTLNKISTPINLWETSVEYYWSNSRSKTAKITDLFVELHDAQGGEDPGTGWWDDLRISKADPLQYLGTGLRSATTEGIIAYYQRSMVDKKNIKKKKKKLSTAASRYNSNFIPTARWWIHWTNGSSSMLPIPIYGYPENIIY